MTTQNSYQSLRLLRDDEDAPPKPLDPLGRYVSWLQVTAAPRIRYDGEWITVDDAFFAHQLEQWALLTQDDYTPPILAEHDPKLTKGERIGDILELVRYTVKGVPSLIAAVGWAFEDADIKRKIKRGAIKYVSPRFKSFEDDRGIVFDFVLAEISIVASPHQKRLGGTHILAGEGDNMNLDNPPVDAPSLEDRIAVMERKQDDLIAAIAKLMAPPELEDEVVAEEDEDEKEDEVVAEEDEDKKKDKKEDKANAAMSERVAALEKQLSTEQLQRRRAEFNAAFPSGKTIVLSEELREEYFAFSEASPKAYAKVAKLSKAPEAGTVTPRRSDPVLWGASMGESGSIDVETDDELMARLRTENPGNLDAAVEKFAAIRYQKG